MVRVRLELMGALAAGCVVVEVGMGIVYFGVGRARVMPTVRGGKSFVSSREGKRK